METFQFGFERKAEIERAAERKAREKEAADKAQAEQATALARQTLIKRVREQMEANARLYDIERPLIDLDIKGAKLAGEITSDPAKAHNPRHPQLMLAIDVALELSRGAVKIAAQGRRKDGPWCVFRAS